MEGQGITTGYGKITMANTALSQRRKLVDECKFYNLKRIFISDNP